MPYVQVNFRQTLSDEEKKSVSDLIDKKISLIPGKKPEITLVNIVDGCFMHMGYSQDPVIFVDIRMYKQAPLENKNEFVRDVTENLSSMFGVKPGYIYFCMGEYDNWGVNGAVK